MVIVKLQGGLGNQMFQYACARALAIRRGTQVFLDLHALLDRAPRPDFTYRDYCLNIFGIQQHFASEEMVRSVGYGLPERVLARLTGRPARWCHRHYEEISGPFRPEVKAAAGNIYLDGYWQSPSYFDDAVEAVRAEFRFNHQLCGHVLGTARQIEACSAVCLNVRRADFVGCGLMGTSSLEYYRQAVSHIRHTCSDPCFFVFSDDLAWCRESLGFASPALFVGHDLAGPAFSWYLDLMMRCKHFVIPNSTFAWWAAWLSPSQSKTVCAPKTWFADPSLNRWTCDLIPPEWVRL